VRKDRRKKRSKDKLDDKIDVIFTSDEIELINSDALRLGLDFSAYIRQSVIDELKKNGFK